MNEAHADALAAGFTLDNQNDYEARDNARIGFLWIWRPRNDRREWMVTCNGAVRIVQGERLFPTLRAALTWVLLEGLV